MNKINKKILFRIIALALVLTIIFNFTIQNKVYAEAITLGIATKVIITILGSMGILATVKDNGGVGSFTSGFTEFLSDVKGVPNAISSVAQVGTTAILNNQKMRISEISSNMIEYLENVFIKETLNDNAYDPGVDLPVYENNVRIIDKTINTVLVRDYHTTYNSVMFNFNILTIPTNQWKNNSGSYDYKYNVAISRNINRTDIVLGLGSYVTSIRLTDFEETDNLTIKIRGQYTYNSSTLRGNMYNNVILINNTRGTTNTYTNKYENIPLIYENGITVPPNVITTPELSSTPNQVAFPYANLPSISLEGKTETEVLENIGSISNDAFLDQVLDMEKVEIDSRESDTLVWDGSTVSRVIEGQIDETYRVAMENQGILTRVLEGVRDIPLQLEGVKEGILGIPTIIGTTIENVFTIPEDVSLDFDPLKNITITDRFPFSLPWDLKNTVNALTQTPKAPYFEIPIKGETLVIDLEEFDNLARISRAFMSLIFVIVLIVLTRRFIGGA